MDARLTSRLKEITRQLDGAVAVFGDFMLDEYVFGEVNRISPESPVPVVEFRSQEATPGGAGNVAANIRALGGRPIPFGFVGDDAAGRAITAILRDRLSTAVDRLLVDSSRPTTVKRRIIAHHQQLLRIDYESREPVEASVEDRLIESFRQAIPGLRAIVVSDYNKGAVTRPFFERVFHLSREAGLPLILDPKAFDLTGLGPVTVITPNEREAERFSGCRIAQDSGADAAGRRLLETTGAQHILITRGAHGMSLFAANTAPEHVPTQARDVYDVTGAGDTVAGVLSVALAAGATVSEATRLANLAAGIVVGRVGTASVSREELELALNGVWPGDRLRHDSGRARN